MKNLILTYINVTFLMFSARSQEIGLTTNVDTNFFKPEWSSQNLAVETFTNGKKIFEAKSIIEFDEINKKKNTPAFIKIKNNSGEYDFFYNYYTINDTPSIIPIGLKLPSSTDYKNLYNQFKDSKSIYFLNSTGYVDNINGFTEFGDASLYFWISDNYNYGHDRGLSILYDKIKNEMIAYKFPMFKQYGLSIRCIEDLDYSIKTKDYQYKQILPSEYNEILNRLYSSLIDNYQLKNDEEISFNAQISIFRDGTNDSKIIGEITKSTEILKNQADLKMSLNTVLENSLIPFYHGQIVQSKSEFNFSVKYKEINSTFNEFFIYKIKNVSNNDKKDLERADKFGFLCSNKEKTYSLFENGTFVRNQRTQIINQFHSKGPIYSVYSFIPGLGLSLISKNNYNSKSRIHFRNFLLSTSISLGVISISSKIASNIFYNRYKNDLHGDAADYNYKNANALQKVFLSTGVGYCLLGAIDFTWTFSIGCKNKATQLRLNKQIENSPTYFILK